MYLQRFYGDRVVVEYYDMANPEAYAQQKHLLEQVPEGYFFYPFVFVDGQLKLAGSAEYYEVLYAVREVLGPAKP